MKDQKKKKGIFWWVLSWLGIFGVVSSIAAILWWMLILIIAVVFLSNAASIFEDTENSATPLPSKEVGANAVFSKTSDFFYSFFTENTKNNYENYYVMKDWDRYMIVPDKYMNYQLFWYHCNPIEEGSQRYAECTYLNEEMQEEKIRVDNDSGEIIDWIYKYPLLKLFNPIMIGQTAWLITWLDDNDNRLNSILNQYNVVDTHNMLTDLTNSNSITIHNKLIWYLSKEKQIPYLSYPLGIGTGFWKRMEIPWAPWTNGFNDLLSFYGFWKKNAYNPGSYLDWTNTHYNFVYSWTSFPNDPYDIVKERNPSDHNAYDYSAPNGRRNTWVANPFYWGGYYLWTIARDKAGGNNHTGIISKYWSPFFYYDYTKKELYDKWKSLFINSAKKSFADTAIRDNYTRFLKEVMAKNPKYKDTDPNDLLEKWWIFKEDSDEEANELLNNFLPKENENGSILLEIFWMYWTIFWEDTLFWNYYKLDTEKAKALVDLFEDFKNTDMSRIENIVSQYYNDFFITWNTPDIDEDTKRAIMFYDLKKSDFFLLKGKKQKTQNTDGLVKKYVHLLQTIQHVNGGNQYYQAYLKKRALNLANQKLDEKLKEANIPVDKIKKLQSDYVRLYNLVVNYNLNVEETWWFDKLLWKKENGVTVENDISSENLNPNNKLLNSKEEKDFYGAQLSVSNKTFFDVIMPWLKQQYNLINGIFNTINDNLQKSGWTNEFANFLSKWNYRIKNDFVNKTMSIMRGENNYALPFVKYGDFYAQHGNSWLSQWPHWHWDMTVYYSDNQVLTNNDLINIRNNVYWKDWYAFTGSMEKIFNDIFKDYKDGLNDINDIVNKVDNITKAVKDQLKNGIKTSWDKGKVLKAWKEINEVLNEWNWTNKINFNLQDNNNSEVWAGSIATFPWNWWITEKKENWKVSISANSNLWKINEYVEKIAKIKKEWIDIFKEANFFSYDNFYKNTGEKCNYNDLQNKTCTLSTYGIDWNIFYTWSIDVSPFNSVENALIRNLQTSKNKYRKYNMWAIINLIAVRNSWMISKSYRRMNFVEKIQAYTLLNKLWWGSFINIDNNLPIFSRTLSNNRRMHWPAWDNIIDTKMVESYVKDIWVKGLYDNLVRNFPNGEWSWTWEVVNKWWETDISGAEMNTLFTWKFPDSLFEKVLQGKKLAYSFRRPIPWTTDYEYKTILIPTDFLHDDIYQDWWFSFIWLNERWVAPQVAIPAFNYFYGWELSANHNLNWLWRMMTISPYERKNGALKNYDIKNALKNINNVLTKSQGVLWMQEKIELTKLAKSQILMPLYWNIYTLCRITNLSMLKEGLWNYKMQWFYNPNTSITSNLWLFADIIQLNQVASKLLWNPQKSFEEQVKEDFIDSISNDDVSVPKEKIEKDFNEVMKGLSLYVNKNKNNTFITSIIDFLRASKIAWISKDTVNKVYTSTMSRFGKKTDILSIEGSDSDFRINMKNLWWLPIVTIWWKIAIENWKPKVWSDLIIKKIPFDNSPTCKEYLDLTNWGCWLSDKEYQEIKNISKDLLKELTWTRTFEKDAKLLDAISKYNYSLIQDSNNYDIQWIIDLLKENLLFSAWPYYEIFYWHPDNISIVDYELTSSWSDDFFLPMQLMTEVNSWTKTYIVNWESITNFEQLKEAYLKAKQRIIEYYQPIAKEPIELTPLPFILYMTHLSREETWMTDTRYDNCKNWMWCKVDWKCLDMNSCISKIESWERVEIDSAYKNSSYANKSFSLIVENWKVSVDRKSTALGAHEAWDKYFNNESHPTNWKAMNFKNVNIYTLFKTYNMNGIGMYGAWQFSPWQFLFSNGRSYKNTNAVYGISGDQFGIMPDWERYLYLPEQLIQWSSWWGKGGYLKKSFQEEFVSDPNIYLPPSWSSMNCSVDKAIQWYKFCSFINSYNRANWYGVKYLNSIRSFLPEILMNWLWGWGGWSAYLNSNAHNISAILVEFYKDNLSSLWTEDPSKIQQLFLAWVRRRINLIYEWKIKTNEIELESPDAHY